MCALHHFLGKLANFKCILFGDASIHLGLNFERICDLNYSAQRICTARSRSI